MRRRLTRTRTLPLSPCLLQHFRQRLNPRAGLVIAVRLLVNIHGQHDGQQLLDERYQQYLEAEFADDPEKRVARAAEGKPAVIPDWDGPLFCYASDRVAQDGCKVQIMDRLFPEREDMGWESGWAFYSGDEGDVYGEGDEYYESHCGFYDIRDICRIDPDIIPLLNLPYGTMQMRGEDGAWYEVIRDDEGEEET